MVCSLISVQTKYKYNVNTDNMNVSNSKDNLYNVLLS